tara:strand:+ start:255 stop:950 length:696 start_codon:yes stop_codon:yes gene_type:complete
MVDTMLKRIQESVDKAQKGEGVNPSSEQSRKASQSQTPQFTARTSKKNTNWNVISPGDVVSFRYKSTTGSRRSILREVICLDPLYRYRKKSTGRIIQLFIGLEINNQERPALRPVEITELLDLLSKAGQQFSRGQVTAGQEARMRAMYKSLELFLKKHPIFKTYLLRECRKYRVFEENKYADLQSHQVKGSKDEKQQLLQDFTADKSDIKEGSTILSRLTINARDLEKSEG